MAKDISHLIDSLVGSVLDGEDGESLVLVLNPPAPVEQLESCERRLGIPLPEELRRLLSFSDGLNLFGCAIMSASEVMLYEPQRVVPFHNWGNGDFDCIAAQGAEHPEGSVVFMNHSPDVLVRVAPSLSDWLVAVVAEIAEKGTLVHPADYRNRDDAGIYGNILHELRGVNCELNR